MKNSTIFLKSALSLFFVLAVGLTSCDKSIEIHGNLADNTPTSPDANAGTWRMIVLPAANSIAVAPPASVTSDAYVAELAAVKDAQKQLTKEQKSIIKYWSAGGILRWNQLFRDLVAEYNLPPAPKADNTYPVPNAENPFGDPNFPFANPPYAARAYSYVSVAQYEALKAAWHYKSLYNRPAPYQVDSSIENLMPVTGVSAYPSEDAVMSGAAADMLKALFPAAVRKITLWAADQRNAALWSGRATASDISAGLALGKAVVMQMLARAGTDGMGAAGGNKAMWDGLAANAESRGETPWISQDTPKRPPMLPAFGNVRAWNMSAAQITASRPAAPPPTASGEMATEVAEVLYYSQNMTRERLAIVHKWADGAGTYTPPGHWNDIAEEYIAEAKFSEVRAARAFALLNMAMHDAAVGCWNTKFFYFNPRPSQMNPGIKTLTGLPNFPAYTSGHSTFSAAAATVLSYLFPQATADFEAQATEASLSRLYGAIHYRSDCEMGLAHGKVIGGFTVNSALTDGAN
ncbi:MAG TPA: phosphatase PAP2 family protein [Chryseosolibacter sp.]